MLSTDLAKSLREMAATFPLSDEEQRTLRDAELMLERVTEHVADMKQKGDACRRMASETEDSLDSSRLGGKASVFTEEARRLERILEGK